MCNTEQARMYEAPFTHQQKSAQSGEHLWANSPGYC